MSSKTARASAVKEVAKPKVVIPDTERLRLIRLEIEAGIYPSSENSKAVVRLYDLAQEEIARLKAEPGLDPATQGQDSIGQ
jgi:hypothetical protein